MRISREKIHDTRFSEFRGHGQHYWCDEPPSSLNLNSSFSYFPLPFPNLESPGNLPASKPYLEMKIERLEK